LRNLQVAVKAQALVDRVVQEVIELVLAVAIAEVIA
jgi:hypothetical protein